MFLEGYFGVDIVGVYTLTCPDIPFFNPLCSYAVIIMLESHADF